MKKFDLPLIALASAVLAASSVAFADDASIQTLLKDSKCLKCHSVDKKKSGPPFKETAEKYVGKADAEQKLYTHLTTGPMVEVDGEKEKHGTLKTQDEAAIKEVIAFILKQH